MVKGAGILHAWKARQLSTHMPISSWMVGRVSVKEAKARPSTPDELKFPWQGCVLPVKLLRHGLSGLLVSELRQQLGICHVDPCLRCCTLSTTWTMQSFDRIRRKGCG